MTPRRPPDLDPKGRGDKRMVGKQEAVEDVYTVVLQRLSDMAKTALFEPLISRGGSAHSSAAHLTPTPSRAMGSTFAHGTPCTMADAQRGHSRVGMGSLRRSRDVPL